MSTPTEQDHGLAEADSIQAAAAQHALDLAEIKASLDWCAEQLRFKPAAERQAIMNAQNEKKGRA